MGRNPHLSAFTSTALSWVCVLALTGAVDFSKPGKVGKAAWFNGSSALRGAFVHLPRVSVSAWVNEDVAQTFANMIVTFSATGLEWNSWELRANGTGYTFFAAGGGPDKVADATDTGGTSLGTWVHLAAVYDGSESRIYRNGVHVASSTPTTPFGDLPTGPTDLTIGYSGYNGSDFFRGGVDEFAIFDQVLNDPQIAELYAKGQDGQRVVP